MTTERSIQRPELLAPAGNWDCVRAAVVAGADAVYFGLPVLNARMRADNFTLEDLPSIVEFLHEHEVRAHVTLNTLVFTEELAEAASMLRRLEEARVDAVIIQDLGFASLARDIAPSVELHASTQMTITSPEGVRFARSLGVDRVVLARELSLREIDKLTGDDMLPLEVFVHGALCVAYSGQCLTSESLGQRSANRGECAQACRMPYDLIIDGEVRDLGDRKYLLSPQDLAAVDEVGELIDRGVVCFKIEGRLKAPEYVAAVTRVYRKAIDAALEARAGASEDSGAIDDVDRYELEMTFSRGLFTGWVHGVDHQKLVHARFGKKRGPFVGRVARIEKDAIELDRAADCPLAPGDGVVFDTGEDTNREQGGRIYELSGRRLGFERGRIDFSRVSPGDRVWKTSDPKLERRLRKWIEGGLPTKREPIDLVVSGVASGALAVECRRESGTIRVESEVALEVAERRPLSSDVLESKLGRLGGTRFELGALENRVEGEVILPVSELNRLRRRLVAQLESRRASEATAAVEDVDTRPLRDPVEVLTARLDALRARRSEDTGASTVGEAKLVVLVRTEEQLRAAITSGVSDLILDYEDPRRYSDSVREVRAAGDATVFVATPRIQKAGEHGLFRPVELSEPDGVLVRNLGGSHYFRERGWRRLGDFSLNVANPLSADVLLGEGFERITLSYDLDAQQVLTLFEIAPPGWFELTIHQHMPMFHMEHCVFAAFLSSGKDHTDCGRPCDVHKIHVRDRVGVDHPVAADVGCRNTVFNAQAQSGASYFGAFRRAGLGAFRVELLDEDGDTTREVIESYRELLAGSIEPAQLLARLRVHEQLGVTGGTLNVR